ncbi:MAG: DUF4340 domain-containing protein [Phycisphaerae bacterium]|nr:DUF4340 domain-containing protein [Phycisphaerae bacterium]
MNFRTTILLVLLLVILGGVYFMFVAGQDNEPAKNTGPATPATTVTNVFDPPLVIDDITRIVVERQTNPKLVFERRAAIDEPTKSEWWLIEPVQALCEKWQVDGLARNVTQLTSRSHALPGQGGAPGAAECGLEPPVARVSLTMADGKSHVLEVGKVVALSNDTYARIGGAQVIHIAKRDIAADLNKDPADYRAKTVLRIDPTQVVAARVTVDDKSYAFSKSGADWAIDEPFKAFADAKEMSTYLGGFRTLRADDFADTDPSLCGFDTPRLVVELTTEQQREVTPPTQPATTQPAAPEFETVRDVLTLTIGGAADLNNEKYYARTAEDGAVFTLASDAIERFKPDMAKLRDSRVARVAAADIERLTLTTAGQEPVTLTRTDGVWSGTGDLRLLDQPAVEELTTAIENLRAMEFEDEPAEPHFYGLDEPRGIVEIQARGQVTPVVVRIGAMTSSGRNAFVRVDGQPSVQVVSAARVDSLLVSPLALRSREIFEFARTSMIRLEVVTPLRTYQLVREDGQWRHMQPEGAPADLESIRSLVNNLSALRARQVVAKGEPAAYGLDDPTIRVSFELAEPAPTTQADTVEPRTVHHALAASLRPDGVFCQRDDEPYIYELEPTLRDVLTAELFDRKLFDFGASDVAEFKVEAPGGTNYLLLKEGVWGYPPDSYVQLSQKKVTDFVTELAAMRVEKYFEYDGADLEKSGLAEAPVTVSIRLKDDRAVTLKIAQEQRGSLPRVAFWIEKQRWFLMRQADVERLLQSVDQFIKPDQPEQTPAVSPQGP